MQQKSARLIVALCLVCAMCTEVAFASDGSSGNFLQNMIYRVTGFTPADEGANGLAAQATASLYPDTLTAPPLTNSADFVNGSGLSICSQATNVLDDGILIGSGDSLYYFRKVAFPLENGGFISAFRSCERYNVSSGTWSFQQSLPEWLEYVNVVEYGATADNRGFLVLTGTTMDTNSQGIPAHAANPRQRVYMFNLDGDVSSWSAAATNGVPVACGLINNGGVLQTVGGLVNGSPSGNIYDYELANGTSELKETLSEGVVNPRMEMHNRVLYVATYGSSIEELRAGTGSPRLIVHFTGMSTLMPGAFPASSTPSNTAYYPSRRSYEFGSLAWADAGCVFVGPLASDNSSDTFVLPWDGEVFSAYSATAHETTLAGTAACVYLGKLYALASSVTSTEDASATNPNTVMVFRATGMADASVVTGENSVWRQGSVGSLPFEFSPNFSRFKGIVRVDGQDVYSSDFDTMEGSTVINLHPGYLEGLALGEHTMTAVFDSGYTEVSADFSIEVGSNGSGGSGSNGEDGSGSGDGYTSPVALATTSDRLPVMPLAVCAVAAASAMCVAVPKRGRQRTKSHTKPHVKPHVKHD